MAVPPVAELYKALKDAQLEISRREETERKMQDQINDLRNIIEQMNTKLSEPGGATRRRKKERQLPPVDEEVMTTLARIGFDDKKVQRFGKMYMMIGEPWILPGPEMALNKPCPDVDHTDPRRYRVKSEEESIPYIIAEIYHYVPEPQHVLLEKYGPFKEAFIRGFNSMRTNAINNMRKVASIVFNVDPVWLVRQTTAVDRAQEPVLLRYLQWKSNKPPYDPRSPPVLFPNCVYDPRKFMRNPQLVRLLSATLFGEKSALKDTFDDQDGDQTQPGSAPKPRRWTGPPPHAVLWGLKKVTPGLIAFGAIAATFLLSADEEFAPVGLKTQINYYDRFQYYKKTLLASMTEGSTAETFRFYQERLFPQEAEANESFDELAPEEDPGDAMLRAIMAADAADRLESQAGRVSGPSSTGVQQAAPKNVKNRNLAPSNRTAGDGQVSLDSRNGRAAGTASKASSSYSGADTRPRTRGEAALPVALLSQPGREHVVGNPSRASIVQPALPLPQVFHRPPRGHARPPSRTAAPSTYPHYVETDDVGVRAPEPFNLDEVYNDNDHKWDSNSGNQQDDYDDEDDYSNHTHESQDMIDLDDDQALDLNVHRDCYDGQYSGYDLQSTSEGADDLGDTANEDDEDVVTYKTHHVSQPPDISVIAEEPEEATEEDYDELEYIEIDEDDQTDHGMGPPTDSDDGAEVPARSSHRQDLIGPSSMHAPEGVAAQAPRQYSHRLNEPPRVHSSMSLPLPRSRDVPSVMYRAPSHPPAQPVPRAYSGTVPRSLGRTPMVRSFSDPTRILPAVQDDFIANTQPCPPSIQRPQQETERDVQQQSDADEGDVNVAMGNKRTKAMTRTKAAESKRSKAGTTKSKARQAREEEVAEHVQATQVAASKGSKSSKGSKATKAPKGVTVMSDGPPDNASQAPKRGKSTKQVNDAKDAKRKVTPTTINECIAATDEPGGGAPTTRQTRTRTRATNTPKK
ncbi:hypothetical protein BN946_scf184844.g94 [Trametes cinnabarina]|uniref:Uncharacterized protein n=1 Tax=Pycnoporus cinnabarinus TaxID=5643 RepID=A0A060S9R4_PYCCI|nr:hypothetical protein BN946_scf184844.g94 [Trametes cinnabarina]